MSLYTDWKQLVVAYVQTIGHEDFLDEYSKLQEKIYSKILKHHKEGINGSVSDLASKLDLAPTSFIGIIDGLNSSLKQPLDLDKLDEHSKIELDIDYEKLFISMIEIGAANLYTLSEWNLVFSRKYMEDLIQCHSDEKTLFFPKEIKRNSPCPCGSGKKFKHCCGMNN